MRYDCVTRLYIIRISLKNIKNELRYFNKLREANNDLEPDQKRRVVDLFNMKREFIREILVLKSAFSIVDQMFLQEIKNAEVLNQHWLIGSMCCNKALNIKDPENINKFIMGIMDPFKDKEESDKREAKIKRKAREQQLKEERLRESTTCCWPSSSLCYKPKYEETSVKITREFITENMNQIVEILEESQSQSKFQKHKSRNSNRENA